jgi:hypothetical protein
MVRCTECVFCDPQIGEDLSAQAMAVCGLRPENGRHILHGNGCEDGQEVA